MKTHWAQGKRETMSKPKWNEEINRHRFGKKWKELNLQTKPLQWSSEHVDESRCNIKITKYKEITQRAINQLFTSGSVINCSKYPIIKLYVGRYRKSHRHKLKRRII